MQQQRQRNPEPASLDRRETAREITTQLCCLCLRELIGGAGAPVYKPAKTYAACPLADGGPGNLNRWGSCTGPEGDREREILNSPNNPESETLNRLLKHAELRERKPPVGAHSTVLEMRRALRSLAAMGIPEQLRAVQDKAPFSPFRVWGLVFRGLGVYSLGG